MTQRQDTSLHQRQGASTVWQALFWAALSVLAVLTAVALVAGNGWRAELSTVALVLAAAVLPLGLVLRRNGGAVLALACAAVQAVWLMPSLMTPSVVVADVPDGMTRVASIDRVVSSTSERGFAAAVDSDLRRVLRKSARADGAVPVLLNTMLILAPTLEDVGGYVEAPAGSAAPGDLFSIGVRGDGSIVIEWFGRTWVADELPALLGDIPGPQRI